MFVTCYAENIYYSQYVIHNLCGQLGIIYDNLTVIILSLLGDAVVDNAMHVVCNGGASLFAVFDLMGDGTGRRVGSRSRKTIAPLNWCKINTL